MWKNVGVCVRDLHRIAVDSGFCTGVRVKFFPALLFARARRGSSETYAGGSSFCSLKCPSTAE